MRASFVLCVLMSTLLGLSACAHDRGRVHQPAYGSQVLHGHVRAIEQFGGERRRHEAHGNTGTGAVVGGVVGGLIGNQIGRGSDRAAATVVGAVAGAVIGNEIERQEARQDGRRGNRHDDWREDRDRAHARYRVWVKLRHGAEQAFDFDRLDGLRVGDPVRIVDGRLQRY